MASFLVMEDWDGQGGSENDQLERDYKRKWKVQTDDKLVGPMQVRDAMGAIAVFQTYTNIDGSESDPGARLTNIDCQRSSEDPYWWNVTAEYSTKCSDPDKQIEDPLERPLIVEFGFDNYQRPMEYDTNGDPIRNPAGDPYDPKVTVEEGRPYLRVIRNEEDFDAAWAVRFQDSINDAEFLGFEEETVKVRISAHQEYENSQSYWKVTYLLQFRREYVDDFFEGQIVSGWQPRVLAQGFRAVVEGKFGLQVLPVFQGGHPTAKPVLLAADGTELPQGYDPIFQKFECYRKNDFSELELDDLIEIL